MGRRFQESTLLIASQNPGKVSEFQQLLAPYGVTIVSALDFDLEEPLETGETLEENALLKARYYMEKTGLPSLADDSGLRIAALKDWPGVRTKDVVSEIGLAGLQQALGQQDSTAHLTCVLALVWPDHHSQLVCGHVDGRLVFPARGSGGFGVDSIFQPHGYEVTFAQDMDLKYRLSHRVKALELLVSEVFGA
jgi:XTP/dITP diphosphohydrolase